MEKQMNLSITILLIQLFIVSSSCTMALASSTESTGINPENYNGILIYRSFNGTDYLYSLNSLEGPKAGYYPQEARFGLFPDETKGTKPLYRCLTKSKKNKTHFLTTDTHCEGQTIDENRSFGGIATEPADNLVPLYRYVNLSTNAHAYVLPNETSNFKDWKPEGIQGYVIAINTPVVAITPDDGKKYFGFYAGAMDGVGNKNYIPELAQRSNVIFIKSPNFEAKLLECEQLNLKAVITFDWIFFDENFSLKKDYAEVFTNQIEPILKKHLSTIVAFYGQDEPYANGMKKGISAGEIYHAQETMGRFLKSKFPDKPIGVILSTKELKDSYPLFPSFDWFGFDCYSATNECKGKSVDWLYKHLDEMLKAMTAQDTKNRYIISVPQAGHSNRKDDHSSGELSVRAQVPKYYEMIRTYPNVKIVMPFIWQTFNDGTSNWSGAREMPGVVDLYLKFYQDFMSGIK